MATVTWQGSTGSQGNDWEVGSNWSTGNVPGSGDGVVIPGGTVTPDLKGATASAASVLVPAGASADLTGNLTIAGDLIASGGVGVDTAFLVEFGGSVLTIGGTLVAANSGAAFTVGNRAQTAPTTVIASAVTNTGTIDIAGNAAAALARINVLSTAGFGGLTGVLTGNINLGIGVGGAGGPGDALLDFVGGGLINTIESGTVQLTGPDSFIATGNAISSNSALAGALTIAETGALGLQAGASVATQALTVAGNVSVDTGFLAEGGSVLTVNGVLTVSGNFSIGRSAMVGTGTTVTVTAGLSNSGTIGLNGDVSGGFRGALDVGTAAGFGTVGVLSGNVVLTGLSLLDFASGLITSIDRTGNLQIDGTNTFLASGADTSSNSALTGLAVMDGFFTLSEGAALTTSTNLSIGNGVNGSNLNVDTSNLGGSALHIGGTLTINGFGGLSIGDSGITAATTVTAAALDFVPTTAVAGIDVEGGMASRGGTAQASLTVASVAGFGQAGMLSGGNVSLSGTALLDFTLGGQITVTAFGANLTIDGAGAFLASADAITGNSALTGLRTLGGNLTLLDDASVTTDAGLSVGNGSNGANLAVNTGASLAVGGALSLVGFQDTLSVQSGSVTAGALANAGGIFVGGSGMLQLGGPVTNSGGFVISSGGTVGLGTNAYDQVAGSAFIAGVLSAGSVVIAGGSAEVAATGSLGSAQITFGGSATLRIDGTAAPANLISAFGPHNAIDLAGIGYDSSGSIALSGNTVILSAGGSAYDLNVDPGQQFFGEQFAFVADGHGGTEIVLSAIGVGSGQNLTIAGGQYGVGIAVGSGGIVVDFGVQSGGSAGFAGQDYVEAGGTTVGLSVLSGGDQFVEFRRYRERHDRKRRLTGDLRRRQRDGDRQRRPDRPFRGRDNDRHHRLQRGGAGGRHGERYGRQAGRVRFRLRLGGRNDPQRRRGIRRARRDRERHGGRE